MSCWLLLYYRFKFLKNIAPNFGTSGYARTEASADDSVLTPGIIFSLPLKLSLSPFVWVGRRFMRSVLVHMSRKLRASQANGGARRDRTADLLRARQALSQLSYGPFNLSFFRQARRI